MSSTMIAGLSVACMFGGALVGLCLQRLLPPSNSGREWQAVVKLGAGVIATVTALALGLLISSAKSTFDDMSSRIIEAGAKMVTLNELLARYGPETRSAREQLRRSVDGMV